MNFLEPNVHFYAHFHIMPNTAWSSSRRIVDRHVCTSATQPVKNSEISIAVLPGIGQHHDMAFDLQIK